MVGDGRPERGGTVLLLSFPRARRISNTAFALQLSAPETSVLRKMPLLQGTTMRVEKTATESV